jgi:hypothetical protein
MIPVTAYFGRLHLGHQLIVRQKEEGLTDFGESVVLKCTECWIDPDEIDEDFGDDPADDQDEETLGLYYHETLLEATPLDDFYQELLAHDRHALRLDGQNLVCLTEEGQVVGELVRGNVI